MRERNDIVLVLTTVSDEAAAERIARVLTESRLAACVNIMPAMRSVYRWQGAIEEARELMLIIKTQRARYAELEEALRLHHTYEIPEIVVVPVVGGLPSYLDWIVTETFDQKLDHA